MVIAVGGPHPQAQLAVFQHHDLVAVPFVDIRVDVEELPALVRLAGGHEEQGVAVGPLAAVRGAVEDGGALVAGQGSRDGGAAAAVKVEDGDAALVPQVVHNVPEADAQRPARLTAVALEQHHASVGFDAQHGAGIGSQSVDVGVSRVGALVDHTVQHQHMENAQRLSRLAPVHVAVVVLHVHRYPLADRQGA